MKNITITPDSSVLNAMEQINQVGERTLIVVTEKNKFLGTITDGDIRRNILEGNNLAKSIKKIYNKKSIFLYDKDFSSNDVKKILINDNHFLIPIIEKKNKKFLRFVTWKTIFNKDIKKKKINNCSLVVMAGGKGQRLLPFTDILPKPLIPIQGKPIIDHIIELFEDTGIKNFFLTLNYKSKILKSYFRSQKNKNYKLNFVVEKKPLGTVGSLNLLKNKLETDFFSINCDIVVKHDLKQIYDFHKLNNNDLTIVTSPKTIKILYGVCESNAKGKLKSLTEKPVYNFFVNTGLYVFKKNVINLIPKNKEFGINDLIEKMKKEKKNIGVYPISPNSWFDVGQWSEYSKTNDFFKNDQE